MYKDVWEFHYKFGLHPRFRGALDKIIARKRADQMREELREFEDACADGDALKAVDALVDMVYFACGAALMMGVSEQAWQESWNAVHAANMRKARSPERASEVKQGIFKPEGWIGPEAEIFNALAEDGFDLSYACDRCRSRGFRPSARRAGLCTFCDGTEAGIPSEEL